MNPEVFVDIVREALWVVTVLVAASILPSLAVGLLVAVFQAAPSINERPLSCLPRLLITVVGLARGAHWGLEKLMSFFRHLVELIPSVIG